MPSNLNPDLDSLWGALDENLSGDDLVMIAGIGEDGAVEIGSDEDGCGAAEDDDCYDFGDDGDELIKQDLKRAMEMDAQEREVVKRQGRNQLSIQIGPGVVTSPVPSSTSTAVESIATDPSQSQSSASDAILSIATTTVTDSNGQPIPTLIISSTPASPPAAASTTAGSSAAAVTSDSDTGLSTGAKLGLGIGLGVGIPLLVVLLGCLIFARRRKRHRNGVGGKYTPQGNSDVSMVESPTPAPAVQTHQVPEMEYYEPPKSFEPATYHAFSPSQDYEHYETPVSAVTPLDPQSSHTIPEPPPPLVIPTAEESARHSRYSMQPPVERDVSPISPVSAVSAVSSMGSRSPSPRQLEH